MFFGGSCFLCRGAAEDLLCERCDADLPRLERERCPRCALESPAGAVCGRCLARPPAFDATIAALSYRFPTDVLVHALKFRSELALAVLFGKLLGERVAMSERVDFVVPVPLYTGRLRERGFNQAMEIARPLARSTRARLAPELCERIRDTPAQLGLPLEERRKNVAGAFNCPKLIEGASVALVDDVMTTGSTLDEAAATLKRSGAARVVCWVLARTPPPE